MEEGSWGTRIYMLDGMQQRLGLKVYGLRPAQDAADGFRGAQARSPAPGFGLWASAGLVMV